MSTRALLYYQSPSVVPSLRSTGRVGTNRDAEGSDNEFFGVDPSPTEVEVHNARRQRFTLDDNGFTLVEHAWRHIDYFDNAAILNTYYTECEDLVAKHTGASRVLAFDHNLRARQRKAQGQNLEAGGNAIQEPLITYGVHNDYTLESAPRRIEQLAQPLKVNDTLRGRTNAPPPLRPDQLEHLLAGRWQFVNVWRNVSADAPVERHPLALCDAASVAPEDLVTFEIRYADRVGEVQLKTDARTSMPRYHSVLIATNVPLLPSLGAELPCSACSRASMVLFSADDTRRGGADQMLGLARRGLCQSEGCSGHGPGHV